MAQRSAREYLAHFDRIFSREHGRMNKGLQAAVRRFPHRAREVRDLARSDVSFSALCDDLADTETAAENWAASALPQKSALQREYEALANELSAEIALILGERFGGNSATPSCRGSDI